IPFVANLNSSTAIVFIVLSVWIIASLLHGAPGAVFGRNLASNRVPMCLFYKGCCDTSETTTTSSMVGIQFPSCADHGFTAVAFAEPLTMTIVNSAFSKDNELSESLADVNFLHQ